MKMKTAMTPEGKPGLFLCCDRCGKPMVKGGVYAWNEDENSRSKTMVLLDWKCEAPFIEEHADEGPWFSKGMPARWITW